MKKVQIYNQLISFFQLSILILISNVAMAQVDTTIKPILVDTMKAVQTDTSATALKDQKKKKDKFLIYAGVNFSNLDIGSSQVEANSGLGYHLGFAYKSGSFFYWQVGARYNSAVYNFVRTSTNTDTSKLTVGAFDVPLTAGINFLSFADRLVALRVFVSAVPSFTTGVGENNLNITKDNVNSFILYGQAGIGVDIAFLMIETGYNYGFQNLLKDYSNSNPGQFYVSLGFRF
jgi:Outer membrane protein beta-barrel domain